MPAARHGARSKATVALLAAAAVGLARCVREREAQLGRARDEIERVGAERERLRRHVRRAEDAASRQRDVLRRVEQSRRAEREWNRELRTQLQRLYESSRHRPG